MLKQSKIFRFQNQRYWAENGRIHVEDSRDGEFRSMSRAEFVARLIGFNAALQQDVGMYPDERTEMYRLIHDMIECNRIARDQGDPSEPGVISQVARENKKLILAADGSGDAKLTRRNSAPTYFVPGTDHAPPAPDKFPNWKPYLTPEGAVTGGQKSETYAKIKI